MDQSPVVASKKNPAVLLVVVVAILVIAGIALVVRQPWNAPAASGQTAIVDQQPAAAPATVATAPASQPVLVTRPAHMDASTSSNASSDGTSTITQ